MVSSSSSMDPDDPDEYHLCNEMGNNNNYKILSIADIQQHLDEVIKEVSTVLLITPSSSSILLLHYNWDIDHACEQWFEDEPRVRKAVGLPAATPDSSSSSTTTTTTCGICFKETPLIHDTCRHPYCRSCWTEYISTSIADGPACLTLRCPHPSCGIAVGKEMVETLAGNRDRVRYMQYLTRSYIEHNRTFKWCPSPHCELAVEHEPSRFETAFDITCRCSYRFCWNCSQESHRPASCDHVARWIAKNSSTDETSMWLLANTKPCPGCRRLIEKNEGCIHMTCIAPCGFEFCWLCLGPWQAHKEWTGGCYAYVPDEEGKEAEKKRKRTKESMEAYSYSYECWVSNDKAMKKGMEHLEGLKRQKRNCDLEYCLGVGESFRSVVDVRMQIVECRRVLKWASVCGYYLTEQDRSKKHFFEHLVGDAEAATERLRCRVDELEIQFKKHAEQSDENPVVSELCESSSEGLGLEGMTKLVRRYIENLVQSLEEGLKEVVTGECSREDVVHWYCNRCTFANPLTAERCQVCEEE